MFDRRLLPPLLLLLALAGVTAGAIGFIQHDREALVLEFERDRQAQLAEASREVSSALEDIADGLRFAGELMGQPGTAEDHRRELRALLEAVGQFRVVAVYGARGEEQLTLVDRRASREPGMNLQPQALAATAREALARPPGQFVISPPLGEGTSRWMRVLAVSFAEESPGVSGAVAILVDTEPLFAPLRLVTNDGDTRLLLLGAHGFPAPLSDPTLARLHAQLGGTSSGQLPGLHALDARLRARESGVLRIEEAEAVRLGLGPADVAVAYMPIRMGGEPSWSVATLSSTRTLRSHERTLVLRLTLAALLVALFLVTFGTYVVLASRRAVQLRESRRHADRLAHLHEKTQKILDHIPAGVLALGEDGRLSSVNRALREHLPPHALGLSLEEAFSHAAPAVLQRLQALVRAASADGHVHSLHGEALRLFREEGHYNVHAVPLERGDADVHMLLVFEDLSSVRMLEDQLLRAEKLATVGVLAAGVAHEIGTPLGIIRGRAEYMRKKAPEASSQSRGLTAIIEQIDRVGRTIRQLLDFSRLQPAQAGPVALAPVMHGVAELLQVEADRRKVSLQVELAGELPALAAVSDQLQQVLLNLTMNACDACEPGGHVRLSARSAGAMVELQVQDDGCGISPEHLNQVFDPFFSTKKRGRGTGLGLTVVAQIVRNHGGRIELDSAPGEGTRITVCWPAAAPAEPHEEQRHAV
ncbi:ATP-binding protein [Aggregicoccus sp. 17bor-14]|uniref:ATP-binding protein n=1 Tax=Myxococcaceae TaxID=31 RepID=UPI00351A467C